MKKIIILIIDFFFTKHHFLDRQKHHVPNKLKNRIKTLKKYDFQNFSGSKREWHKNLNELIDELQKNKIKNFLRIKVVRRTMYVSRASYTLDELNYLPTKKFLKENFVGSPVMFYRKPLYSANRIHHQFLLYNFEFEFENFIKNIDLVFEFGGGYGSMCENIYRHNYDGNYFIFDFKEFSIIQEYYLFNTLKRNQFEKVTYLNEFKNLKIVSNKKSKTNSLFIATWSLSEADLETRKFITKNLIKDFDFYLIAFQQEFNEINNLKYFEQFRLLNNNINWEIKLIKNSISKNHNQYFMFGKNNNLHLK